jgi:hypothetical protein
MEQYFKYLKYKQKYLDLKNKSLINLYGGSIAKSIIDKSYGYFKDFLELFGNEIPEKATNFIYNAIHFTNDKGTKTIMMTLMEIYNDWQSRPNNPNIVLIDGMNFIYDDTIKNYFSATTSATKIKTLNNLSTRLKININNEKKSEKMSEESIILMFYAKKLPAGPISDDYYKLDIEHLQPNLYKITVPCANLLQNQNTTCVITKDNGEIVPKNEVDDILLVFSYWFLKFGYRNSNIKPNVYVLTRDRYNWLIEHNYNAGSNYDLRSDMIDKQIIIDDINDDGLAITFTCIEKKSVYTSNETDISINKFNEQINRQDIICKYKYKCNIY